MTKVSIPSEAGLSAKAGRTTNPSTISPKDKWNPNTPIHCTQEEFREHIQEIERGCIFIYNPCLLSLLY